MNGQVAEQTVFGGSENRRCLRRLGLLVIAAVLGAQSNPCRAQQDAPAYKNPNLTIERRVDDLLKRMTLDEKIAQMGSKMDCQAGVACTGIMKSSLTENGKFSPEHAAQGLKNGVGEIVFLNSPLGPRASAELRNQIQKWVIENTRLGIPVLFHQEGLHGEVAQGATSFPQAIGLASSWDPKLIEQVFSAVGQEMRHRGVQQVLAPVLDLGVDPRYGRIEETYGEDPHLVAEIGEAAIRGFQGTGPTIDDDHVIATAKHFLHAHPIDGTNLAPADLSERTLRETYLYPFEVAVRRAGIGSVMSSYNEVNGVPVTSDDWLLRDVLRREWGFTGITVSDYFAIPLLVSLHHVAASLPEAAGMALKAGVDIELPVTAGYATLAASVHDGKLPEALIDEAVARILAMKFRAGMFDHPYVDPATAEKVVNSAEHRALALKAAEEAIVLLKNDNKLLPLDPSKLKTLAVIGPNADKARLGTYSGVPPYFVTVLDGIRRRLGSGITVNFAEGCRISVPDLDPIGNAQNASVSLPDPAEERRRIADAVAIATKSDAVVLVLGGNEAVSREAFGEGNMGKDKDGRPLAHMGDADTLELPGMQNELAQAVLATGKPVVVVLLNGRPYSIGEIASHAHSIVEGWYLGQETGNAMAAVLFGDVNPSGHLPVTIARNVGQLPVYYYQKPSAKRGYIFSDKTPLFPFGFGLSYTSFKFGNPQVSPGSIPPAGIATASVEITNSGTRAGDEVVQMYIHDEISSVTRPIEELRHFARIHLAPGQTQSVQFPITREELMFFDRGMKQVVEPGMFDILFGDSAVTSVAAKLVVAPPNAGAP